MLPVFPNELPSFGCDRIHRCVVTGILDAGIDLRALLFFWGRCHRWDDGRSHNWHGAREVNRDLIWKGLVVACFEHTSIPRHAQRQRKTDYDQNSCDGPILHSQTVADGRAARDYSASQLKEGNHPVWVALPIAIHVNDARIAAVLAGDYHAARVRNLPPALTAAS